MDALTIEEPVIHPTAFVAPAAALHGRIRVAQRAVIMFGVVMRAEFDSIDIGEESNIQDNCVVHCDHGIPTRIGRRVTVGHSAVVHGATVGDHCLVGIGALVLNRSELGEGAWVAAGSVVTEGTVIPPWTLALGTPARPVRELRPDEIERQRSGVDDYLQIGAAFARRMRR